MPRLSMLKQWIKDTAWIVVSRLLAWRFSGRSKDARRVGILVGEFFHPECGGFGGYGMTTKNISDFTNTHDAGVKVDILLAAPAKVAESSLKHYHHADVLVRPPREKESFRDSLRYARLAASRRLDLLLTVEYYDNYEIPLRALGTTPLVIWIRDPRGPEQWQDIATVPSEVATWQTPDPGSYHAFAMEERVSLEHVLAVSRRAGREVRFATQARCLVQRFEKAYDLSVANPIFLPNPINIPESWQGKLSDRPSFAFLGRLDPVKRPWVFFELARHFPMYDFLVAGIAHYPEVMDPVIAKYQDLPNLHFLGLVTGEKKDALLRSAWAFVNTSVHEALPVSFLEAFAYGKPVITCQNPDGFGERFGYYTGKILGDGIDQPSMGAWIKAVEEFLGDRTLAEKKGREARMYVAAQHSIEMFAQQLLKL
jgi:glycosyltransferase involved in cell wall biosynthesis